MIDAAPQHYSAGIDASSGREVWLFDLLRRPHRTLLTFDQGNDPGTVHDLDDLRIDAPRAVRITTDTAASGTDTLVDGHGSVHCNCDITGNSAILIRPDGYIAARVPVTNP